jgi:cold shock CspA family protein
VTGIRHQGRITTWKDDKGFGFITPNGSDAQVFVHIKSFPERERRPVVDDLVTYHLGKDASGRTRAEKVAFIGDRRRVPSGARADSRRPGTYRQTARPIKSLVAIVLVGLLAWLGYAKYQASREGRGSRDVADGAPSSESTIPLPRVVPLSQLRCDGRTHCSQMTSCAEATYFLENCPGVKMDGDNDGVPCEERLCNKDPIGK